MHDCRKEDGPWNRSAIMSRGHEIARSLDEERDYSNRLSEGMTQAWAEAKSETKHIIYTLPSDWQRSEGQDHPDENGSEDEDEAGEVATYHSSRVMDEDGKMTREALNTEEFKEKIEQMSPDHIEATYKDDSWNIKVALQGETLLQRTVADHDDEIMEACTEMIWPLAARVEALINRNLRHAQLRRLKRSIQRQKPRRRTPSWVHAGDERDYVFVHFLTKEIVHMVESETGGVAGAIRSLHGAGIEQDELELWYCEESFWTTVVNPQTGDYLKLYDMHTLTRHGEAPQDQEEEKRYPWETETNTQKQAAGSSAPPFDQTQTTGSSVPPFESPSYPPFE